MDFWQSFPAVTSFSSGSWPAELFQSVTFIATKDHVLFGFIKFPLTLQRADQTHSCREREANPSSFFKSIQHWSGLYLKALSKFRPHNLVSVGNDNNNKKFLVLVRNGSPLATGKSSGIANVHMPTRYELTNETIAWVRQGCWAYSEEYYLRSKEKDNMSLTRARLSMQNHPHPFCFLP